MKHALSIAALLAVLVPATSFADTWTIDASHSSVGFKVRHFFTKVPGTFGGFSGTIQFDAKNPGDSKVNVVIDAASIDTNNEKRDGHLKTEDFFWVEKHPEVTFASTAVKKTGDGTYEIEGILTMRGVSQEVVLDAEFLGAGPDAWGGTRSGFVATTTVNRKDYGMVWNNVLDTGGAVLGDEVDITLDIEAILNQEKAVE